MVRFKNYNFFFILIFQLTDWVSGLQKQETIINSIDQSPPV